MATYPADVEIENQYKMALHNCNLWCHRLWKCKTFEQLVKEYNHSIDCMNAYVDDKMIDADFGRELKNRLKKNFDAKTDRLFTNNR